MLQIFATWLQKLSFLTTLCWASSIRSSENVARLQSRHICQQGLGSALFAVSCKLYQA